MLATAGRRAFLILSLIVAFTLNAGAQLLPAISAPPLTTSAPPMPVIVQISSGANVALVAYTLGATVIDNIFGSNIYLLKVPTGPLVNANTVESLGALPGIDWAELNTGVSLPSFAV